MWGLLTTIPGLANGLLGYLKTRSDADVAKYGISRDMVNSVLANDAVTRQTSANVISQAMNHPVFWIGWLLFVIPPGLYNAQIHLISTFPSFFDGWVVHRVPAVQEVWDMLAIQSLFLAQAGTGAVAGIVHAITNKIK